MHPRPATDNSRNHLLEAGRSLFAQNGFDGTTVRDLAAKAGTNICMVSYHFGGKDGLYRACIEEFGLSRIEVARGILAPPKSREEFEIRLKLVFNSILHSYTSNPEMHRILARELEAGLPVARETFEETILLLMQSLVSFISDAQKVGIVRAELDPYLLVLMIHGSVTHFIRMELISEKYFDHSRTEPSRLDKYVEILTSTFLNGAASPSKDHS